MIKTFFEKINTIVIGIATIVVDQITTIVVGIATIVVFLRQLWLVLRQLWLITTIVNIATIVITSAPVSTVPQFQKSILALKGNSHNPGENRNKLAVSAIGHKAPSSTVPQIHSDIEKTTLITIGKTTNH